MFKIIERFVSTVSFQLDLYDYAFYYLGSAHSLISGDFLFFTVDQLKTRIVQRFVIGSHHFILRTICSIPPSWEAKISIKLLFSHLSHRYNEYMSFYQDIICYLFLFLLHLSPLFWVLRFYFVFTFCMTLTTALPLFQVSQGLSHCSSHKYHFYSFFLPIPLSYRRSFIPGKAPLASTTRADVYLEICTLYPPYRLRH